MSGGIQQNKIAARKCCITVNSCRPCPDGDIFQPEESRAVARTETTQLIEKVAKFCILCQTNFLDDFPTHLVEKHFVQSSKFLPALEAYASTDDASSLQLLAGHLDGKSVKCRWGEWLCALCDTITTTYQIDDEENSFAKHLQTCHQIQVTQCRNVLKIMHQATFLLGENDHNLVAKYSPLESQNYYGCRFCGYVTIVGLNRLLRHLATEHNLTYPPTKWLLPEYFQGDRNAIQLLGKFVRKDDTKTMQSCAFCWQEQGNNGAVAFYNEEQFIIHCRLAHSALNTSWLGKAFRVMLRVCDTCDAEVLGTTLRQPEKCAEVAGEWLSRGRDDLPACTKLFPWQVRAVEQLERNEGVKNVCLMCSTIECFDSMPDLLKHLTEIHSIQSSWHIIIKTINGLLPTKGDLLWFLTNGDHIRDIRALISEVSNCDSIPPANSPRDNYCPFCLWPNERYVDEATFKTHLRSAHDIQHLLIRQQLAKLCFNSNNAPNKQMDMYSGQLVFE